MKFIDWFAGIGGFRRGMELAGHECVGFCEFDKYAVMSYTSMHLLTDEQREHLLSMDLKKRQKEILKEEYRNGEWYANDIRRVYAGDIPRADCWCFGFPCQDISISGKQLGFTGNRSSLFFRVMYLLGQLEEEEKPEWLFIENVKNLLSVNGGWDFAKLLCSLDEGGYDAEWQVLNSKDFGVPQNRERCFIVGRFRGRSTTTIFPIRGSNETDSVFVIKQIGHLGGKNRDNPQRYRVYDVNGIGPSLHTMQGGGLHPCVAVGAMRGRSDGDWHKNEHEQRLEIRKDGVTNTLSTVPKDNLVIKSVPRVIAGIGEKRSNGGVQWYQQDRVYDAECISPALSREKSDLNILCITEPLTVRKLTPRECFRLQGWTDDYFEKAQQFNSDSQLYKQAGNGVTVNVIEAIAKRFEDDEQRD